VAHPANTPSMNLGRGLVNGTDDNPRSYRDQVEFAELSFVREESSGDAPLPHLYEGVSSRPVTSVDLDPCRQTSDAR
jgi:hypothetical protein